MQKMSSPEDLTKNIQMTHYWNWLLLLIGWVFLVGLGVWACVADISTRVKGNGIFLPHGGRVVDASAPFSDTLDRIFPNVGEYVEHGEVIAQFHSSARDSERKGADRDLQQALQLYEQHKKNIAVDRQRRKRDLDSQVENVEAEIAAIRLTIEEAQKSHEDSIKLFDQHLITQSTLSNKRLAYTKSLSELHALQTRLDRLKQTEFEKRYQEDLRSTELQQSITRQRDRLDIALKNLEELEMRAPVGGEVLEIKAPEGSLLQAGVPFMSILTHTVKRHFTSIIVVEGSNEDENIDLLNLVQPNQRVELEFIAYVSASDGKRIRRGTELQIAVDYLDRNEYGMVQGTVLSVSELPVTVAGISTKLANKTLVERFTREGALYEVRAKLKSDAASKNGLAWTSLRGAEENPINAGSLGVAEFVLEKRKPITMLIPLLRSFFVS